MRPMNEIEIELPQIVLDRADAAYAQIRQQAVQEKSRTAGVSGNGCRQGQIHDKLLDRRSRKTGRPRAGDSHGQQASYWR